MSLGLLRSLRRSVPGLAGLLVFMVGLSEAMAYETPSSCRPEIRHDSAAAKDLLYSATCPSIYCPGSGSPGVNCTDFVGIGGWTGCGCPGADVSCLLCYKLTGSNHNGYPVVNVTCYSLNCSSGCYAPTSGGGASPWIILCPACP
jgi:hypothetical protein